jgi:hypothetical protein
VFGYVKPHIPALRVQELQDYKAVYCGLCGELGRAFGPFARLFLSYDFTFLAMLSIALRGKSESQDKPVCRRCYVNPLKKIHVSRDQEALRFGADIAAITLYYKLLDNIADSGPLKKIGWKILLAFAASARKKAAARVPQADAAIAGAMRKQAALEAANEPSLDAAAEPTAAAMAEVFSLLCGSEDGKTARALERLGYLVGRYIYLCDALDDLREDLTTGGYNPLIARFKLEKSALTEDEAAIKAAETFAGESIYMSAGEACLAYNLLAPESYKPILDNIVFLGLKNGADAILTKAKRRKREVMKLGDV